MKWKKMFCIVEETAMQRIARYRFCCQGIFHNYVTV